MMRATQMASPLAAFFLLTSAPTDEAQKAWVLWRHFVPVDNPEATETWKAEQGSKTKQGCESEVKEYRELDPDKRLLDSAGRVYRIEYHCLPDTVDPRGSKGK